MRNGRIVIHQESGDVIGEIDIKLKFDLPDEMMQLLANYIGKGVELWEDRVIINSHNS